MFVALQCKGVGEFGVELGSAYEAFQGLIVITLEGEGIANRTPRLWGVAVYVDNFVGEVREVNGVFEMPKNGGVELHVF